MDALQRRGGPDGLPPGRQGVSSGGRRVEMTAAVLLGILAFLIVAGPRALDPVNIAWLGLGDPAQNYLGWLFFRNADWSFPIGLNPNYGLEIGNAIVYSDSNPLLAFLFKPFAPLLPKPFQYFGLWMLICFILQSWFGWKLAGLLSGSIAVRALGAGLFVFAPPMIWRLRGNLNLAGHFLILASLYLALRPGAERRRPAWALVLAAAALIHAYLLAMAATLWLADLAGKTIRSRLPIRKGIQELAIMLLVMGTASWQAGYFSVGTGTSAAGFGLYRLNLLSIVDPDGWSYVLKDTAGGGAEAGSNFLGLGIILLAVFALTALIKRGARFARAVRAFPVLLGALTGLTVFALSNRVGFGPHVFEYPLPGFALKAANVFRGSERMFWPAFYMIIFAVLFLIVRGKSRRTAVCLLSLALAIQIVDTSAGWKTIRKKLMKTQSSTWATPLVDPFWKEAATRFKKIRWIPPGNLTPKWLPLAAYAGTNGLGTDAVYLARLDSSALAQAQRKASDSLNSGRYEADTLYVVDDSVLRQAVFSVDRATDVLARVDGLNVLAPGWKERPASLPLPDEVKLTDVVPPLKIGKKLPTNLAGPGAAYLSRGWSSPEAWGTWSDGDTAEIVLPASGNVRSVRIEAGALVTPEHPKQNVVVKINGTEVLTVSLTNRLENLIDISFPEAILEKSAALGWIRIQLLFPDAVRPKDIGVGDDDRRLALSLLSITAY